MEITPLIPDGHNGPIKHLACASCRHYFYVTQEDYQSLQPTCCHECSLKQVEVELRKAKNPVFKEAIEQAEQGIKHAYSDVVEIAKLHEVMGRFVAEAYIDLAKSIGKNLTGDDISEPSAIELAKKLLEEDQKQSINQ